MITSPGPALTAAAGAALLAARGSAPDAPTSIAVAAADAPTGLAPAAYNLTFTVKESGGFLSGTSAVAFRIE